MKEEKQFKTLEEWKAHLRRDKTKEAKDFNKRIGIKPMPIVDAMEPDLPEGELIAQREKR